MNTKKILLAFFLVACLLLTACSEDKNTSQSKETHKTNVSTASSNAPSSTNNNSSVSNSAKKIKLIPITDEFYEIESSGHILKKPLVYQKKTLERVDKRIEEINNLISNNPDTKFFLYYVTLGNELSFFDWSPKEQFDFYGYIRKKLNPGIKSNRLKISSVEDYKKYFYKYDHHWNSYGIDVGYNDAYNLLSAGGVNMQPIMTVKNKITVSDKFFGSRVRQMDVSKMDGDPFIVNEYNKLDYDYFYNNTNRGKWTNLNNANKDEKFDYYGGYYGRFNLKDSCLDPDKIKIKTKLNNGMNAVFIGDSYLQGLYEPLAQNFDTSYYVYYWPQFDMDKFIKSNNINVVFYLGSSTYLITPEKDIK
ncbi:MAG: hypothetical protein VR69_03215 [Peptococcaceae bacterium BRH_c4b]|nr:MAG: hypothetical protein VR69_03215 [Peptococcaceae bacterium BRH_c4b]